MRTPQRNKPSNPNGNGHRNGNGTRKPQKGTLSPIGTGEKQPLAEVEIILARGPASAADFETKPVATQTGLVSLRTRNFRLFWSGQAISLIGVWMQVIAQTLLVLQLTNSAFVLGVITALQFLPVLLLSIFGGFIADHLPRRQVLLVTQSSAMLLAFILAGLSFAGIVQIYQVGILALLLGVVNAVDMPTRQAFVIDLVDRESLPNAVALNSVMFNASRLIGPAVGGVVVGVVGVSIAFLANALTFIPAIVSLVLITVGTTAPANNVPTGSIWQNLTEGLRYVIKTPVARLAIIIIAVTALFGMNLNVLLPVDGQQVMGVSATGVGVLLAALGAGSLGAALVLAFAGWAPHPRILLLSAGIFGAAEIVLAPITNFYLSLPILFVLGFFMVLLNTLTNITLQTTTPDALRGRVLSVYTTVFAGTTPLGSLYAGTITEGFGIPIGLLASGLPCLAVAIVGLGLMRGTQFKD